VSPGNRFIDLLAEQWPEDGPCTFSMECFVCAMWFRVTGEFRFPNCKACEGTRSVPPLPKRR